MTVKQISVFLENKPGQLLLLTEVLHRNKIDMRALSVADTKDFGIVRIIVRDAEKAEAALREAGYIVKVTPVLAVAIEDKPGGLFRVLQVLANAAISLEYTYAFLTHTQGNAYMIFRVADNEKAIQALSQSGLKVSSQKELDSL